MYAYFCAVLPESIVFVADIRFGGKTMDECFERIDALLRKQGKSQAELIKYLGLSHGTYNHWKNGRNRSYRIHLRKIA